MNNINLGLKQAISLLKKTGKIIVISYHSIEDRLVKNILFEENE